MSCYESERGTIIIPTKEWPKFRSTLIKKWNEHQLDLFEKSKQIRSRLVTVSKGKRAKARAEALLTEAHNLRLADSELWDLLFGWENGMTVLRPPLKKKDLKLLSPVADASIELASEAYITLYNKTHSVRWEVLEGNHACRYARDHYMGKILFELLSKITWTRGTGGTIVGNDEYNRDDEGEGGGGNYVTSRFGPDVPKPKKSLPRLSRATYDFWMHSGRR